MHSISAAQTLTSPSDEGMVQINSINGMGKVGLFLGCFSVQILDLFQWFKTQVTWGLLWRLLRNNRLADSGKSVFPKTYALCS